MVNGPIRRFSISALAAVTLIAGQAAANPEQGAQAGGESPSATEVPADREFTPASVTQLRSVGSPAISPAGTQIAYILSTPQAEGPDHDDLWIVSAEGGDARALVEGSTEQSAPAWSPNGARVAFLSELEDDDVTHAQFTVEGVAQPEEISGNQVWTVSPNGTGLLRLTAFAGGVTQFAYAPDGMTIALVAAAEVREDAAPRDMTVKPFAEDVFIFDIQTGVARRLSDEPIAASSIAWSPDGRSLALRVSRSMELDDIFYFSHPAIYDVASGERTHRLSVTSAYAHISFTPDGERLAFTELFEGGVHLEPRLYDLETGEITDILDDRHGRVQNIAWRPGSDNAIVAAFRETAFNMLEVDPQGGGVSELFEIGGGDAEFSVAEDAHVIAYVNAPAEHPADIYLYDGEPRRLTNHNPHTAGWTLGDVRAVRWTSSIDGRPIFGVLATPPGYNGTMPLPTVLQIHGGPEWYWAQGWNIGSFHDWARLLAGRGFAVLLPNPRGSEGQGAEFARAVMGDWMGADYQDIVDGAEWLVQRGIADPDRLGIGGWSYGGYASAWSLTQDDMFKAAVIGAPMTNLQAMFGATDTPFYPIGYLGSVAENGELYDARSPVRQLSRPIDEAVLILHTENDVRVPLAQSLELYRRLRELEVEAEYYVYPDEGHWMVEAEHEQDMLERVLTFYETHLQY